MEGWKLTDRELKRYPHFDPPISAKDAVAIATDRQRVADHNFYPFLLFTKGWTRYARKGEPGSRKDRPIRYAARADAYIFSKYRHELAEKYEIELEKRGLERSVLAYRRIYDERSKSGKCNIHFARDAFQKISEIGNCCAIALDISGFFEHLDHEKLKTLWCSLLAVKKLPPDHFAVYRAITAYAVVDKIEAYRRLGLFGAKRISRLGVVEGYLKPYKETPKQLCTGAQFREAIAGGDGRKSLIRKNHKPFGIPQGAPISDLLANIYMLDFDKLIFDSVSKAGGAYYRYSDDILIILPGGRSEGEAAMKDTQSAIKLFGSKLKIKGDKCSVIEFTRIGPHQIFERIHGKGENGLEYLGFRFTGNGVFIRDSTLSNLFRKITYAARKQSNSLARRYPKKDLSALKSEFDYERLIKRFGRVEEFGEKHDDVRNWTFWTYARRAAKLFGSNGRPIHRQLRNHREHILRKANAELERAIIRSRKR